MPKPMVEREEKDQHWRPLFDHLKDKPFGYTCTYHEMQAVMAADPMKNRFDVYRAMKELERLANRTLICVRGQGYRIAEPREHMELMDDRRLRARRQTRRGIQIGKATDRTRLTPQEASKLADMQAHMGRMDQALAKHEKAIQEVQEVQQAMKADYDARISRIEQALQLHQQH